MSIAPPTLRAERIAAAKRLHPTRVSVFPIGGDWRVVAKRGDLARRDRLPQ